MTHRRICSGAIRFLLIWVIASCSCDLLRADEVPPRPPAIKGSVEQAVAVDRDSPLSIYIGATPSLGSVPASIDREDLDYSTPKRRILLIGGVDDKSPRSETPGKGPGEAPMSRGEGGGKISQQAVDAAIHWFRNDQNKVFREQYLLSAIPRLVAQRDNAVSNPDEFYPPPGVAYASPSHCEAQHAWNWIGMHAPDLVVVVKAGRKLQWRVPKSDLKPLTRLGLQLEDAKPVEAENSLAAQLVKTPPAGVGVIPAIEVFANHDTPFLPALLKAIDESGFRGPSPAREELQKRLDRSPLEVARQSAEVYGRDLPAIAYIPAVAAIGQVRLAKLTDNDQRLKKIHQLAAPYVQGEKQVKIGSPVAWAGHLIFAELAETADGQLRQQYINMVRGVADSLLHDDGKPTAKLSASGMSDAVFMGGPILARAGRLTGDDRYFDGAVQHVLNLSGTHRRDDGLWRHVRSLESAWGRGNGFVALGLALVLDDLPDDHPKHDVLLELFQEHMHALARHQDYTGCWHQVIDHEGSYRELSCTCMITYAMTRGLRQGWLDETTFKPVIDRAWRAIRTRIAENGTLVDVCTGTGPQRSERNYLERPAILGRDARGGAMALLIATEMADWQQKHR